MGFRIIACLFSLSLIPCAAARDINAVPDISNEKKYGVAYCLSGTYPESEFSSDSKHIAGSYIQKGEYGIHVYEAIREYVNSYRMEKYVGKQGRNLDVMQCIDLYDSEELKEVILKSIMRP